MSEKRYTPEFKEDAVRLVVDRGYSVAKVASRLACRPIACINGLSPSNPIKQRTMPPN